MREKRRRKMAKALFLLWRQWKGAAVSLFASRSTIHQVRCINSAGCATWLKKSCWIKLRAVWRAGQLTGAWGPGPLLPKSVLCKKFILRINEQIKSRSIRWQVERISLYQFCTCRLMRKVEDCTLQGKREVQHESQL